MRMNYVAAGLTMKLKTKLWGEACMAAIDVENLLVSSNHDDPSYREFYKKDVSHPECLRQFGKMAVIKTMHEIKGKLEDRGILVMYLGRAKDHAADTHRFLSLETELILISRDAIWLNLVYGEYKGSLIEVAWEATGTLLKKVEGDP